MVPDPPTTSCPFCCIIAIGKFCPKSLAYLCSNPEICPPNIPPMPKDVAGTVITKKISINCLTVCLFSFSNSHFRYADIFSQVTKSQ